MGKKDKSTSDMTRRFVSSVELIAAREGAAVLATQAPDAPPITLGKVTFDAKGDWSAATYAAQIWRGDAFVPLP